MYMKKGYKIALIWKAALYLTRIPRYPPKIGKNISDLDYGGDNLLHPYTHIFGKIFVTASVIYAQK